jgi:hypothetical protein
MAARPIKRDAWSRWREKSSLMVHHDVVDMYSNPCSLLLYIWQNGWRRPVHCSASRRHLGCTDAPPQRNKLGSSTRWPRLPCARTVLPWYNCAPGRRTTQPSQTTHVRLIPTAPTAPTAPLPTPPRLSAAGACSLATAALHNRPVALGVLAKARRHRRPSLGGNISATAGRRLVHRFGTWAARWPHTQSTDCVS